MQSIINTFNFFKNFQSSTMLTVQYNVDESKSKTVNKKKVVSKITTINVGIGQSYSNKVNKKLDKQGDKADFNPFELRYAVRIPNTKNMLLPKKVITADYKNFSDSQLQEMITELPLQVIAENALLQCITENSAQEIIYFYTNPETAETSQIDYKELNTELHVTPSFFKEKPVVGRGSLDKDNDFKIFNVYLKNLTFYKHGGETVELR